MLRRANSAQYYAQTGIDPLERARSAGESDGLLQKLFKPSVEVRGTNTLDPTTLRQHADSARRGGDTTSSLAARNAASLNELAETRMLSGRHRPVRHVLPQEAALLEIANHRATDPRQVMWRGEKGARSPIFPRGTPKWYSGSAVISGGYAHNAHAPGRLMAYGTGGRRLWTPHFATPTTGLPLSKLKDLVRTARKAGGRLHGRSPEGVWRHYETVVPEGQQGAALATYKALPTQGAFMQVQGRIDPLGGEMPGPRKVDFRRTRYLGLKPSRRPT